MVSLTVSKPPPKACPNCDAPIAQKGGYIAIELTFGVPILMRCRQCNLVLDGHVTMDEDDAAPAT